MNVKQNYSLRPFNTFGIEALAANYAEVFNENDILELLTNKSLQHQEKLILGGGSNILLTGDFDGLVIHNRIQGIELVKETNEHVWVKASAGEVWHQLVMHSVANGYAGIENLSLIPGCCGAAPMQNIGAYGVELKDVFDSLEAIHINSGEKVIFSKSDCAFGYRESVFKNEAKGVYIITSITLRLNKQPHFHVDYGDLQKILYEDMMVNELTLRNVSDAVIKIRQSKLPDPKELGNAGSFFKNPEIPIAQYEALKTNHPLLPGYPSGKQGMIKLAAGWLIEQCGWKGKRIGNTGCHAKQALVLVNYGEASGDEIWAHATHVINDVWQQFGVKLSPEVNLIH
jgi:UDP-N-acetylmuramate dehydrogenase